MLCPMEEMLKTILLIQVVIGYRVLASPLDFKFSNTFGYTYSLFLLTINLGKKQYFLKKPNFANPIGGQREKTAAHYVLYSWAYIAPDGG